MKIKKINLYSPARFLRLSGDADCLPCVLAGSPAIFLTKNCLKDKLYKPELIHRCISPGE